MINILKILKQPKDTDFNSVIKEFFTNEFMFSINYDGPAGKIQFKGPKIELAIQGITLPSYFIFNFNQDSLLCYNSDGMKIYHRSPPRPG